MHISNFGSFGPRVWLSCLDTPTYIQTYIHAHYEPKYILDGFVGVTPKVQQLYRSPIFGTLALHTNGKRCGQVGPYPCGLSKGYLSKVPFLA